jgi:hypothetical protein
MTPRGVTFIRALFVVAGLLVFAGLYAYFIIEIWTTDEKKPPSLDKQLVYVASLLAGILGTFFAVALGIQAKDPDINQRELKLGTTLVAQERGPGAALGTVALWLFFAVGAASVITAFVKTVESPDSIKALAATFGGYGLAIFGAAFGTPAPTQGGAPPGPPAPPAPAPGG